MNNIRMEMWNDYQIHFIEYAGKWYAHLEDICSALELDPAAMEYVLNDRVVKLIPSDKPGSPKLILLDEEGIYEALLTSNRPEARKFKAWTASVLTKLRTKAGLQEYEALRLTEPDIQVQIDHMLDSLYWDEESGRLMQSVTVAGGDVEQLPFE